MMEKGHPQGKEKWRFIWGGGKRFPLLNYHVLSPMHQQINWLVRMSSPVLLHSAWRREFFLGFGLFKFSHWNIDRERLQLTIIFQKDKSCRGLNRGWAGRTDSSTAKPMNCSTDSILSAIDFGLQYGHLSILDLGKRVHCGSRLIDRQWLNFLFERPLFRHRFLVSTWDDISSQKCPKWRPEPLTKGWCKWNY